jgi:hypothetical protein
MNNSDIAAKIQRIIAKADSSTSENEADTFMTKAHALMEAHGLSLLDLGKLDSDDPIGHDRDTYISSDPWKDKIGYDLARYYGAELITKPTGRTQRSYFVFGRLSARATFSLMLPFVLRQVATLALAEHRAHRYPNAAKARTALANALCIRLKGLTRDNQHRVTATNGKSSLNALVPVDLIQQEIDQEFTKVTPSRAKFTTDFNAVKKAETVSLNRQTSADKSALRIERTN